MPSTSAGPGREKLHESGEIDDSLGHQFGIAERQRGLKPDDAERSIIEFNQLGCARVRRMVGGNHRDRTVGDALDEGETVLFRTQRRIHLVIRAVSLDALVGQRQVVRRRFAGDRNPLRPGVAEQLHALLDADHAAYGSSSRSGGRG